MLQFVSWIESVEESLNFTDKQCSELRDKAANLGKAKVLYHYTYIAPDVTNFYMFTLTFRIYFLNCNCKETLAE